MDTRLKNILFFYGVYFVFAIPTLILAANGWIWGVATLNLVGLVVAFNVGLWRGFDGFNDKSR